MSRREMWSLWVPGLAEALPLLACVGLGTWLPFSVS